MEKTHSAMQHSYSHYLGSINLLYLLKILSDSWLMKREVERDKTTSTSDGFRDKSLLGASLCSIAFRFPLPPFPHPFERYSRRCHNLQAAHAGWGLLGSADSTPLWLLSSFPSWVWAYLLSNSKTNHSQFLLELFILVLFIPENSHFWLVCKHVMKAGTLAFKDKASVDQLFEAIYKHHRERSDPKQCAAI